MARQVRGGSSGETSGTRGASGPFIGSWDGVGRGRPGSGAAAKVLSYLFTFGLPSAAAAAPALNLSSRTA